MELKRLNVELKKQNEDQQLEVERLRNVIDESYLSTKPADAYKKIHDLEDYITDVSQSLQHTSIA